MISKDKILYITFFLLITGPISADLFLPALPDLAEYFKITGSQVQMAVPVYFLTFGLSQFLFGYLSDLFGRRKTIIVGITLCLIGSLICLIAMHFAYFMLGRAFQGLGLGASVGIVRALWKDYYDSERLSKLNSLATSVNAVLLVLLPLFGGVLTYHYSWQSIFYLIVFFNFLSLTLFFFFGEDAISMKKNKKDIESFFVSNINTIKNGKFVFFSLIAAISFGVIILFISQAPIIIQTQLGYSSLEYGKLMILPILGLVISGFANISLVEKHGSEKAFNYGVFGVLCSSISLAILSLFQILSVHIFIFPIFLAMFSLGIVLSNSFPLAMKSITNMYGTSSSLYGAVQLIGSSMFIFFISEFFYTNLQNFIITYLVVGLIISFSKMLYLNSNRLYA